MSEDIAARELTKALKLIIEAMREVKSGNRTELALLLQNYCGEMQ